MHPGNIIALGILVALGGGLAKSTLARDRDISTTEPLRHVRGNSLDKANGVDSSYRFFSAPPGLSAACATSVWARVIEGLFVDHHGGQTADKFRSRIIGRVQLMPREAEQVRVHTIYALSGEGRISVASCANLNGGLEARGICSGIISADSYTIAYNFDPIACRYDNVAVAKVLQTHLSVGNRVDLEPERDCATTLEAFVKNIDDVLATKPRNILDVHTVLNRYFPLRGCKIDVAFGILKKSKYFRSVGMNGPKTHVFVLNSETAFSPGVVVSFGLTDTGDSHLPSATWSPPFL
jgi:hypothetical protein